MHWSARASARLSQDPAARVHDAASVVPEVSTAKLWKKRKYTSPPANPVPAKICTSVEAVYRIADACHGLRRARCFDVTGNHCPQREQRRCPMRTRTTSGPARSSPVQVTRLWVTPPCLRSSMGGRELSKPTVNERVTKIQNLGLRKRKSTEGARACM